MPEHGGVILQLVPTSARSLNVLFTFHFSSSTSSAQPSSKDAGSTPPTDMSALDKQLTAGAPAPEKASTPNLVSLTIRHTPAASNAVSLEIARLVTNLISLEIAKPTRPGDGWLRINTGGKMAGASASQAAIVHHHVAPAVAAGTDAAVAEGTTTAGAGRAKAAHGSKVAHGSRAAPSCATTAAATSSPAVSAPSAKKTTGAAPSEQLTTGTANRRGDEASAREDDAPDDVGATSKAKKQGAATGTGMFAGWAAVTAAGLGIAAAGLAGLAKFARGGARKKDTVTNSERRIS